MAYDDFDRLIGEVKPVYETPNSANNLFRGRKIVLYGAGDGLGTFETFVLSRYALRAEVILDIKFQTPTTVCGIPACSPHGFSPSRELMEQGIVVITVGKREYHPKILATLKELGFRNIFFPWDVYEYHLPILTQDKKEFEHNYYAQNRDQIQAAYNLMADEESKTVFNAFLRTHLTRQHVYIPNRPLHEQYFPLDIPLTRGKRRMINCGSYIGDTIIKAYSLFKIETLVCFEPDPDNFLTLHNNVETQCPGLSGKVIFFPCGVYSSEVQLRFHGGKKSNSMVASDGNMIIQCVSLDHALPHFGATFITMDIEGSESEAVRGAQSLICESNPDLAICVYHSPSHIWEIPLFIHSLKTGYIFYLRNYTSFTSETVLYASPVADQ